jgi:predicted signal transduction protein with EAL and GGDEF domain
VAIAQQIREFFAQAGRHVDGHGIGATVSVGVSHCEGPAMDVTGLLAQADRALYLAKENGRNRVEVASLESYLARANVPSAVAADTAGRSERRLTSSSAFHVILRSEPAQHASLKDS